MTADLHAIAPYGAVSAMVGGTENVELSTVLKDEARFFTFTANNEDAVPAKDLKSRANGLAMPPGMMGGDKVTEWKR